ncbi:MAG TPA: arginine--tRNA ligase [Planctomycetota bacterium]|nr:arginine--tRNA ligase [Planctomycetota bacterium]
MTDLKQHLLARLAELAPAEALALQLPKDRKFGDVALACFAIAKARGEQPAKVAAEIAAAITPDDVVERAEAVGPFVNFRWRRAALADASVGAVLRREPPFAPWPKTGKSIVIDFSSPNIAKPFHIGHLRSTVIGAALVRMNRHVGHTVHGINHLGDWGAQFGKIITAWLRWGSEEELARSPMRHLFDIYVRYGKEAKADPSLDAESAEHFRRLESGEDNEERRLWQRLRQVSLQAFEGPYRRLGVTFDHVTGESFYEDKMEAALERVRAAGVLTLSDGAEVVELREFGIEAPCILRKSDGTTIYATRDLAAIFWRAETFRFDRALYVVGHEQRLHFAQLKAVLTKMGLADLAARIEHVPFGLVLAKDEHGKWGKFATRTGNAVFLDEVLDEAVANAERIIAEKNPDLPNRREVAEQVGVSAIVFNDLRNARIKDVKFDWDQMLTFEGETGPYVQYAVARLSSILRKAGADAPQDASDVDWALLADAEHVCLSLLEFGPTLARAVEQSEPSELTAFVIRLAGDVHSYLRDHHVLSAEPALKRARLALVRAARDVLRDGLGLLGVAAPEEM